MAKNEKIIVIGAGIGGLACALRLAAEGQDVTVVERHSQPGGKMRTQPSMAGPVDAGPTVLTMRPVFEDLFDSIGERLSDHVTLEPEDILARHWWRDSSSLDLFADPEQSAAAVRDFAGPRAETEFRSFSKRMARLYDAFDGPMMQAQNPTLASLSAHVMRQPGLIPTMAPLSSLASLLKRQFSDPRLQQLFGRYATYVGGSPYQSPALLGLIWHSEARGVWRVAGGMHQLAQTLVRLAKDRGVEFKYNSHVSRLEVQSGKVAAVHLQQDIRLTCDKVVFNGDPDALIQGMLGEGTKTLLPKAATAPRSLSACVWSFAAKVDGLDLQHHNVFFGQDPRHEFDPLRQGKIPDDPTLYICAQDRGLERAPPDLERFEIIMNAPPTQNTDPSPQEKETCQTLVFETLRRFGLTFQETPGPETLIAPAEFNALFPGSGGSLYGRSPHGMMAAFQRPTARTPLPGLYLVGGGVHPGAGIPMATLSARHAAAAIMNDLASTSMSHPTAMPGGISTGSKPAAGAPSRSSVS
ncbi:UNVERIFIED_CONTAM: hypothetical protein GTU68_018576 [Idotea baltica]|nr:hypothetical protein [Idotea baltica]